MGDRSQPWGLGNTAPALSRPEESVAGDVPPRGYRIWLVALFTSIHFSQGLSPELLFPLSRVTSDL